MSGEKGEKTVNIGLDKTKFFKRQIVNIFLPISFSKCIGCSIWVPATYILVEK